MRIIPILDRSRYTSIVKRILMPVHYSRKIHMPFDKAVERMTESLQRQGFGIITTIDLKETLKQKIGVQFRNYRILGACNPNFAYKAVSLDSHVGVMLPCNVVVQEHENGEVEVSAINPLETLNPGLYPDIKPLAMEIANRLRISIDDLHREAAGISHTEALPT